jgi:ferredoxin
VRRLGAIAIPAVLLLTAVAAAQPKYTAKLPDWYERPETTQPAPRSSAMEYVDVAVLVAALAAASYLAIKRRSRRGLFVLALLCLGYFGFYRRGCICPIGAIQNVSAGVFDAGYAVPLFVVALFVLPLLFALLFGRVFCAAVCPLGAVQEVVALRPVAVPAWLGHGLGLLAWAYLGLAVLLAATGTAQVICRYDPFVAIFRLSGPLNMLVLAGSVLLVGVFVARPYCRYVCPLGALLRVTSSVSKYHVGITPGECIRCRLCEGSCPYGAIRKANADAPAPPRSAGRKQLVAALLLAPVLIGAGAYFATFLSEPLAGLHWKVQLADRVRQERTGLVEGTTDASEAFHKSGADAESLYADAADVSERFVTGTAVWGAFLGLVVGAKLTSLSVRRTRKDYEPDRAMCFSCGRCFEYCPVGSGRLEEAVRRREAEQAAEASA